MDENSKVILNEIGVEPNLDTIEGTMIPREMLLSDAVYEKVKPKIPELKQNFSSSYMTSLHENAGKTQKWPLLNLVRQILSTHHYQMKPHRKSDGYTKEGVKKYKRFFLIVKEKKLEPKQPDSQIEDELNMDL